MKEYTEEDIRKSYLAGFRQHENHFDHKGKIIKDYIDCENDYTQSLQAGEKQPLKTSHKEVTGFDKFGDNLLSEKIRKAIQEPGEEGDKTFDFMHTNTEQVKQLINYIRMEGYKNQNVNPEFKDIFEEGAEETKRELIKKHIEGFINIERSSLEHFAETGKVSGTCFLAIKNLLEEYGSIKKNQGIEEERERVKKVAQLEKILHSRKEQLESMEKGDYAESSKEAVRDIILKKEYELKKLNQ